MRLLSQLFFFLFIGVSCNKENKDDYYIKFLIDGSSTSGVPAVTVNGNNFSLLHSDGTLTLSIGGLSLFNGVGEYQIGTSANKYSLSVQLSQNGLPTIYTGISGVLKISEVTDTYIRGQFNSQISNVNNPTITKQLTNGDFYAQKN